MRKINEIILHCSATAEGKDYTVDTIRKWHLARGFNDVGYHYVIYRDGSIHKGRDISKVGAHCLGHNSNSIGICYIGGLDSTGKKSKDTRTTEQKEALLKLVHLLMDKYNITLDNVLMHRDLTVPKNAKSCPCFTKQQFDKEFLDDLSK